MFFNGAESEPIEEQELYGDTLEDWQLESVLPEDWEDFDAPEKKISVVPDITPSRFTEFAFRMPAPDGMGYENFSFEGRRHMRRCYDTPAKRVLLCCARQVEKSTLLGNTLLCYSCLVPAHKSLYISPSATQTKTFSADRLKEPIETSPILSAYTTKMLSQNVFEKQFANRSKITLRYAFLNADRCVTGDTRVYFTDGSVASVAAVFENKEDYVGRSVWAADPQTHQVQPAVLTDAVDQGVRQLRRVRLRGGAQFDCTANQPLLTQHGWKQLDTLSVGDFVAAPRAVPHGAGHPSPVEEFRLVGYLLGDGSVKTLNAVALHSSNEEVLADFQYCARTLGAPLWRLQDSNRSHWVNAQTKRQGFGGGRKGYKKRLVQLGLIGKDHSNKSIPEELFTGSEAQIAGLLSALYATDGWASVSAKGQFEIGYASNSRQLLVDMKQLLLRFGVNSYLSKRKKPSTKAAQGAYSLSIRHHRDVLSFCASLRIVGKSEALHAVYEAASRVQRGHDEDDRIPLTYAELRRHLRNRYGLSTHSAWNQFRIQLRPGNVRDSVGRGVLLRIGSLLGDSWLLQLANSPLYWARIESIEKRPAARTYDLSIDRLENYLSDGVYLHNTRGVPAWRLAIDELQDILFDNIPVIEQCTAHAPERWKSFYYSGTPKSLDNTIEYYRSRWSTQGEWVVPCDRHGGDGGRYWNVLGERNIGKEGLICEKCGGGIHPMNDGAQWANMVAYDPLRTPFESYRISQLMVPWRSWNEIMLDYQRYPRDRFYNEVLGISCDSGTRPLTAGQLIAVCDDKASMSDQVLQLYKAKAFGQPVFMGVDWGSGSTAYTVVFLGTYDEQRFRIFYAKRFTGDEIDPEVQIERIAELVQEFNVALIGVDWGFGFGLNDRLIRRFGRQRVHKFHYMARVKKKVEYDPGISRFKVHRTEVMSDIFSAIKRKQFVFPRWEEFKTPFADDMLNIYSEYNDTLKMLQYDHNPDRPDDSFHALVYCFLVSMLKVPRPDIITPHREDPTRGPLLTSYKGPVDQG